MRESSLRPEPPDYLTASRARWILLGLVLVGGLLRLCCPNVAYFNIHAERDLYRALEMISGHQFHILGSELSYGGRSFGPFVYFLLAIPLLFSVDPAAVNVFSGLLGALTIPLCYSFVTDAFSRRAGLVAAALFAFFPLEILHLRHMWNPVFIMPLTTLMFWGVGRALFRGEQRWLPLSVFAWAALTQCHLSGAALLVSAALCFVLCRQPVRRGPALASVAVALFMFAPFLVDEMLTRFGNLGSTVTHDLLEEPERPVWRPNWHAPITMTRQIAFFFDTDDAGVYFGFTYFLYYWKVGYLVTWRNLWRLVRLAIIYNKVLLGLFAAGVVVLGARLFRREGDTPWSRRRGVRQAVLIFGWLAVPALINFFFSYHPLPFGQEDKSSIMPYRYFFVWHPAQFVVVAVGLVALWRRLGPRLRLATDGLFVALCAALILIAASVLWTHKLTGNAFVYINAPVPTLGAMKRVARVLVEDFRLSPEAVHENLAAENVFNYYNGECSLDFLLFQDRTLWENPEPDPDIRYMIYRSDDDGIAHRKFSGAYDPRFPYEGLELLETVEVGDLRVSSYIGETDHHMPSPRHIRNWWIGDMKYLRPFGGRLPGPVYYD